MLVPMLVLRLDKNPENFGPAKDPSPHIAMHNDALQRLIQIGPKFPVAFKVRFLFENMFCAGCLAQLCSTSLLVREV